MCGFAGIVWHGAPFPSHQRVHAQLDAFEARLLHRGPNEGGRYVHPSFAVVHRRLSIVDIAQGQQPMSVQDGLVGIAYNGEVYNHLELRKELALRGHTFATHCDTEVVLKMFLEYGPESFSRLDGMFAAFIWDFRDSRDGVFYLVRDHLGVKPLYVYEDAGRFAFSSELTPLLSLFDADLDLNPNGLASYLTFRYCHAPDTFFSKISRIDAGTCWRISRGRKFRTHYWDLPQSDQPGTITEPDARERLVALLRDSVKAQQMSEVPVGLFLSGGIDSTVIASLCGELGIHLKSFNIGFPDVNEFAYSKEVANTFGLEHIAVETTPHAIIDRFPTVVDAMDEPIADPACFPLHVLCEQVRKSVTVILSGEGSDEMLAGYPQYRHVFDAPPAPSEEQFRRFLEHSWYFTSPNAPFLLPGYKTRNSPFWSYFAERPLLPGMLAFDLKTWLPENLMMKADKILMSHSLEGRFPFLSKALVEFVCSLPDHFKLSQNSGKHLLRQAFRPRIPKSVLSRPKMGFSVPIDSLVAELRERVYPLMESLRNGRLSSYIDFNQLRRQVDNHYANASPSSLWIWTITVLLQWFAERTPEQLPAFSSRSTFDINTTAALAGSRL